MRIAIVTLTRRGLATAKRLAGAYAAGADIFAPPELLAGERLSSPFYPLEGSLTAFCGRIWPKYRGLVFIMAAGIVVRCVAPYLEHKTKDPAVVVLDEKGEYVISLLGGHLGGANALARCVAELLGGKAVITTASDGQNLPALDVLAREAGLRAIPAERLTRVMAALVNGRKVGLWAEDPWMERLIPKVVGLQIHPWQEYRGPEGWEAGVLVTSRRVDLPSGPWIFLRPQELVAGIGCRRGIEKKAVLSALGEALKLTGRSRWSLLALATVEIKAGEEGLRAAAQHLALPLWIFKREQLATLLEEYPELSRSRLVEEKIGIGGVCEPAALLGAQKGELLCRKVTRQGVTVALARAVSL